MIDLKNYTLFEPIRGKTMLESYPELGKVPEFTNVSDQELKFSWYFANKTSPFYNLNRRDIRISSSFDQAFGLKQENAAKKQKYLSQLWGDAVQGAIERWAEYNDPIRYKAKKMLEKTFNNYESIIDKYETMQEEEIRQEDGSIKKVKRMSADQNKSWVDLSAKILATMPDLVAQIEAGYGINQRMEILDKDIEGATEDFEDILNNTKG